MYCTNCGSEIPDDAKFCTYCGETTDYSTRRQIQPTQPTSSRPAPSPTPSVSQPKSSSALGGIIAGLCVIFAVGTLLIYFGATSFYYIPSSTAITLLVIGSIIIFCIGCSACSGCGTRRRRRGVGYVGGGGDCSGCDCDCSGCDCDCSGCDC